MQVLVDQKPVEVAEQADLLLADLIDSVRRIVAQSDRVLANIAVEGQRVPADELGEWLARPCEGLGQVAFETADPRALARDALGQVAGLFGDCAALYQGAVEMLNRNNMPKAMERLAGCLGLFKAAQEAVSEAVALCGLDLSQIHVEDGTSLEQAVADVTGQLGELKSALEDRDMVLLRDLLTYEFPGMAEQWQTILSRLDDHLAE